MEGSSKIFIVKYYSSFCPLFYFSLILLSINAKSQNLVPNPSFEDHFECPEGVAGLATSVIDWYSFSSSPDYMNVCNNTLDGNAGVPSNAWGYQFPLTGQAYTAVGLYAHYGMNIREYMAAPLIDALMSGEQYYVSFNISHFDGGIHSDWRCAVNRIGLKFFLDPTYTAFPADNAYQPQNTADVEYNLMFSDSANWTLVEGWFTADQPYNWIALGNFYDDINTDTLQLGNPDNLLNECITIVYIDNVCIAPTPKDCAYLLHGGIDLSNHELIKIYPNPVLDLLLIEHPKQEIKSIIVIDISGQELFKKNFNQKNCKLDCSTWAKGMYILHIELDDGILIKTKIIKS